MNSLNISYKIVPVADGEYGSEMPNKSWNGLVGALIRGVSEKGKICDIIF